MMLTAKRKENAAYKIYEASDMFYAKILWAKEIITRRIP